MNRSLSRPHSAAKSAGYKLTSIVLDVPTSARKPSGGRPRRKRAHGGASLTGYNKQFRVQVPFPSRWVDAAFRGQL